ncbi:nucleotide-binding universal stress UspA family protein [Prauserella shujinwangii]|uniref:Nucleotide-binding universal stress UspA family protein n=1 Tax=Prauserella shujinwangii TaxID=1453103 RepID=A0A2T0LPP5_9PSEU|nr:universal stress protein [Prauserella shujinwangii]PRX45205.1 nucleotide-binding universal stress UspA family protein [Prauserella shujinwangii]
MGTIVAGVDGSASGVHAAAWAAAEAGRRNEVLRLVHAYVVPTRGYPGFLVSVQELREGLRTQGRDWLREAKEAAERAEPRARVETELVEAEAVPALLHESREAHLIVLGSRGLGGFTGMLVGSVAVALAAHGHCPVAVVRAQRLDDPPPQDGPVVVGVDGSEASSAAVELAYEEASLRGAPLIAVHTWSDAAFDTTLQAYPLAADPARVDEEERLTLAEQLAGWQEKYPDVPVERVVTRGRPVRTLLDYAERAQLVVVGSRGRGGFTGMLLGSTSRALVTHAACPVLVVRPETLGVTEDTTHARP